MLKNIYLHADNSEPPIYLQMKPYKEETYHPIREQLVTL